MGCALHGDRRPSGAKGLKGDSGDRGVAGSRGPTGKRDDAGPGGPPGKSGKAGPVGARGGAGARGEQSDKGDTGGAGQQGAIGLQGGTGPQGSQGVTGAAGLKGDKGDPEVDIDIVAELCKHLPMEMVEQYRRGAYVRYAINSMKDIELHDATHVKTIIHKCGSCNATQSNVTRMASLSQTQVNTYYVLNFHSDAYNMDADMADFHYFYVFLVYKIKAYAKIKHWERNYLISNWNGEKETKYRGICFIPDNKKLRIHGSVGSDDSSDFRAWRKTNPCEENKFHVICVERVRK